MDDTTKGQAPATDDQELAKVLAGMNQQVKAVETPATDDSATADAAPAADTAAPNSDGLKFEETPPAGDPNLPTELPTPSTPVSDPVTPPEEADTDTSNPVVEPTPIVEPASSLDTPTPSAPDTELDGLKKDALAELRPLVDHLELPASEKFDTLLLIIRSTDDKSLLASAHEAAKAIEDDTKRAQALLDIIKEIDYFSAQPAA